jgi:signal transduction histidine kinase
MRRRLLLSGLLNVTVIVALLIVPFAVTQARYQVLRTLEGQRTSALSLAPELGAMMRTDLRQSMAQVLSSGAGPNRSLVLYDQAGNVRSQAGPRGPAELTQHREWIARVGRGLTSVAPSPGLLPNAALVSAVPVRQGEQTLGALVVIDGQGEVRRSILREWAKLLLAGLAVMLGALIVALPLTRWMLRPIGELDTAMQSVSRGAQTQRLNERTGPQELRSLSRTFNVMAEAVHDSFQRQQSVAADASHQLRTPLTALRLRIEQLGLRIEQRSDPDRHDLHVAHQRATTELKRMQDIIEQVLASVGPGAVDSALQAQRVADIIADRSADWVSIGRNSGTEVLIDIEQVNSESSVLLPDGGLVLILDSLVDNALKYSPPDSIVALTGFQSGDSIELTVSDAGPGLPQDELELAFRRHWRADRVADTFGTGLGLPIARNLARYGGGDLHLERNADGRGLRAVLRLPLHHRG